MKALYFAVFLLFFVSSISVFAMPTSAGLPPDAAKPVEKINLNKTDAQSLVHLVPGIGKKRAEAIIKYRNEHGSFKSIAELAQVRGFSQHFIMSHLEQLMAVLVIT